MLPLLTEVFDVTLPEPDPDTTPLTGEARAQAPHRLLLELLEDSADQAAEDGHPLVLLLEDLHWADGASLALLKDVVARNMPVVVLATLRPPVEEASAAEWLGGLKHHDLLPLTEDESGELVHRLAGSLDPALAKRLCEVTDGNPLFLEELARSLSSVLEAHSGRFRMRDGRPDAFPIPSTLDALLTSRTDRLKPRAQLVLKAASVIGHSFNTEVVAAVLQTEQSKVERDLDDLVGQGLLVREATEQWHFRHALTREVTHEHLLFAHRQTLHKRLAEWYESQDGPTAPARRAALAHHWEQAGVMEKALSYYVLTAEQARARGAHHAVIRAYEASLRVEENLVSPVPRTERARWYLRLGAARVSIGRREQGRNSLAVGLDLIGYPVPKSTPRMVQASLAQLARQMLRRSSPLRAKKGAVDPADSRLEAARAYEQLGYVYYAANEPLPGVHAALRMLNLAEMCGPSPELARAYVNTALAAAIVRRSQISQYFERRAAWASEQQDLSLIHI